MIGIRGQADYRTLVSAQTGVAGAVAPGQQHQSTMDIRAGVPHPRRQATAFLRLVNLFLES
jgi:hypothetical protein